MAELSQSLLYDVAVGTFDQFRERSANGLGEYPESLRSHKPFFISQFDLSRFKSDQI